MTTIMSELTLVLKESGLKKFKSGHPWVFANDSFPVRPHPKLGEWCRLEDEHHQFLAMGTINVDSQIVFREWTRDPLMVEPLKAFKTNLNLAKERRASLPQYKFSHRLTFSEGDSMSGVIIDCYKLLAGQRVYVVQLLTAGAERFAESLPTLLDLNLENEMMIIQRSAANRKREGIAQEKVEIVGSALTSEQLAKAEVLFASASPLVDKPMTMVLDLLGGQKTGFFLDQYDNIRTVIGMLPKFSGKTVRLVDMFCYLGQWGVQLARHLKAAGYEVEVDFVDISEKALTAATENLSREGITARKIKLDYVKEPRKLAAMPGASYDIVILDPPALIKSKKDKMLGHRAYQRVNDQALMLAKVGGVFVSCSCSYNLSEDELRDLLKDSVKKAKKSVAWVAQGWQSKDHPMRPGFPEGTYLKAFMGLTR
jgi:23S rRNA (cytosine1962-C5)-methyltransferase